jgi:pimeloyl-ACP methyl ester carboxylesterase
MMIPGAPADAGVFAGLAELLSDRYTVVTYDTRGTSRSTVEDRGAQATIEIQGDDAHRLLAALTADEAYVFGCSGGALIGLDLVNRYPGQVHTVVAHEPPAMNVLPDKANLQAMFQQACDAYPTEGVGAAMMKFIMAAVAVEGSQPFDAPAAAPEMPEFASMSPEALQAMARMQANSEYFLSRLLPMTIHHTPDVDGLRAVATKIVLTVGEASPGQMPHRAGVAIAGQLGTPLLYVPGDHQGFATHPGDFARTLRELFAGDEPNRQTSQIAEKRQ